MYNADRPLFRRCLLLASKPIEIFLRLSCRAEEKGGAHNGRFRDGRKIDDDAIGGGNSMWSSLCFSYKLNSAHVKYYRLLKAASRGYMYVHAYAGVCVCVCGRKTRMQSVDIFPLREHSLWECLLLSFTRPLPLSPSLYRLSRLSPCRPALPELIPGVIR